MDYVESYRIVGTTYGIEDYEQPGDHFCVSEKHKRFECWVNGCGIGEGYNSIVEAREFIRQDAIEALNEEIGKLSRRLFECQEAAALLKVDPLVGFKELAKSPIAKKREAK